MDAKMVVPVSASVKNENYDFILFMLYEIVDRYIDYTALIYKNTNMFLFKILKGTYV